MQAVFDGHNDVLLRLWQRARGGSDPVAEFVHGTEKGHIDAPRAREGGLVGGLCAIYIPSGDLVLKVPDANGHYSTPLSAPLDHLPSLATALEIADIAFRLDRVGAWRLCRSTDAIRTAIEDGVFVAVLHMEGCEAIGPDLAALETFHAAGLRSLGPVWTRLHVFGHGVPFADPMSPDPGGLARYPIKALILVSFALIVLQGLSHTIKLVALIRGERVPELRGVHEVQHVGDSAAHGGHV